MFLWSQRLYIIFNAFKCVINEYMWCCIPKSNFMQSLNNNKSFSTIQQHHFRKYFQGSKHKYFCGHRELINPTILWWNVGVCLNLSDHIKQLESEPDFHSTMSQSKNIFFFYLKEKEKKKMLLQIFAGNGKKKNNEKIRNYFDFAHVTIWASLRVWHTYTQYHKHCCTQYLQYQSLV